jgi:hypothetical protein
MAFNPFHAFRKHQKVLLACVTLLAMISFIMCSGVGAKDLFLDTIPALFGGKSRTPQVTTLYGKTVKTSDVLEVRRERQLAQEALAHARAIASQRIAERQAKLRDPKDNDPESLKEMTELSQQQEQLRPPQYFGPQFSFPPGAMYWRMFAPFQDKDKLDNVLDFMLWRHQAEKLGIDLTPDDINNAVKDLTFGYAQVTAIFQGLRESKNYGTNLKLEDVQRALGDEFRVRIAQAALIGYEPVQPDNPNAMLFRQQPPPKPVVLVPGPVTPYEFRNRYIHLRTGINVALVPVPVAPSLAGKVTEQDQRDMRALYNLYKDREPVPDQSTPGFKVPRKLRLEWVGASHDSPYFQKQAAQWRLALRDVQRGPGSVATPQAGGSLAPVIAQTVFNSFFDPRQLAAYDELTKKYELRTKYGPYKLPGWQEPGFVLGTYTTRVRAEDAAGAVGQLMSGGATPGFPAGSLMALAGYQAPAVTRNRKDLEPLVKEETTRRLQAGVTLVGLAAAPFPVGALAACYQEDRYLPPDLIKDEVAKAADMAVSRNVMAGSLSEFQKNIDDRRSTPAKARQWLDGDSKTEGAIQKYGLTHGIMTDKPLDRYEIGKDKALAPLKDAYVRDPATPEPKGESFSRLFFGPEPALYHPGSLPAEHRWPDADEVFLFWTVEDKPAYVPGYEEAKPQVEAAWKLQKARPLARKEAEQFLEKVQAAEGDVSRIRDLAAQAKTEVITLPEYVRRQVPSSKQPPAVAHGPLPYEGYKFPDTLSYPRTTEWLDKILALKKKGEAVLLVNQPETTFYVAVALSDPLVPDDKEIAQAYGGGLFASDPLLAEMTRERREEHRAQALKELRAAAGAPLDEQQTYRIDPQLRKELEAKGGGSDSGE